jgi:hypothetical protein
MKAPKHRRAKVRAMMVPKPDNAVLTRVAEAAFYVGSPEHKSHPSFAGAPGLRSRRRDDATPCDPSFANQRHQLTEWLREAILAGQVSSYWEGDFPRYCWLCKDGVVYEARLVNQSQGGYKGYALRPIEYPKGWQ